MQLDLEHYNYEERTPTTINQCIDDLVHGYADANVYTELGKSLMEVLEDRFFHQWPLIRYKYASMLFHGYYNGPSYQDNYIEGDEELAIELLLPMAEEGLATAQYDLGFRFHIYEEEREQNLIWMLKASKQGYYRAQRYIDNVFDKGLYKDLSDEVRKAFLLELTRIHPDDPITEKQLMKKGEYHGR